MTLKTDLEQQVTNLFKNQWSTRHGQVVPSDEQIKFMNDAVILDATVLYADLADSTKMVDGNDDWFSAEIYKTFLYCAARIVNSEAGTITAYDGDRIMAVYLGKSKNTSAVRTAMKIRWAVEDIIMPKKNNQYPQDGYGLKHVVGIDTSRLFVAKTGVRGSADLVWVGRAANYAAKLSSLPSKYTTYITHEVYINMHESAIRTAGNNMWYSMDWKEHDGRKIYGSNWKWPIE